MSYKRKIRAIEKKLSDIQADEFYESLDIFTQISIEHMLDITKHEYLYEHKQVLEEIYKTSMYTTMYIIVFYGSKVITTLNRLRKIRELAEASNISQS